jgi:precorrin-6B methylase 2
MHSNPVSDIAWAPAMGRSYHIIAVASREPKIKVTVENFYRFTFFIYTLSILIDIYT